MDHFEDLDWKAEEVASLEEDLALARYCAGEFDGRADYDEADLITYFDDFVVVETMG